MNSCILLKFSMQHLVLAYTLCIGMRMTVTAEKQLQPADSIDQDNQDNLGVLYVIGGFPDYRTTSMFNVTTTDVSYIGTGDQALHDVYQAASVFHEGHIYIIGSYSQGKNLAYNTDTGVYTELSDNIRPRRTPAVFTINERLYVVGGQTVYGRSMESIPLHTLSAGWRSETAWLNRDTENFAGCVVAGTAIVAGGWKDSDGRPGTVTRHTYTWQPGQPRWTRVEDMNTRRSQHCMVCAAGHAWVIGGMDAKDNPLSSMHRYNVEMDAWEKMARMPEPRVTHQCVHDGAGRILVTGGIHVIPDVSYHASSDIFIYNIEKNQWHKSTTSLNSAVESHSVVFVPNIK